LVQDPIDGISLRESAAHCGVNKNTTLKWRHRMLNNAKKINETLNGIVEFDESYFLESHKGERNLKKKLVIEEAVLLKEVYHLKSSLSFNF